MRGACGMEKFICSNCGFVNRFRTTKNGKKRYCNNCGVQVYNSKVVLESMMRIELLKR